MSLEDKVKVNSFDLARKMHELYREYKCDHELPEYEDLAAKIEQLDLEMRQEIGLYLEDAVLYQVTPQEIMQEGIKVPFTQKCLMLYSFTLIGAVSYASTKLPESEVKEKKGFKFWGYAVFGGLKTLPAAVKEAFKSTEAEAKMLSDYHNAHAKSYFSQFKAGIEKQLTLLEHKWN